MMKLVLTILLALLIWEVAKKMFIDAALDGLVSK